MMWRAVIVLCVAIIVHGDEGEWREVNILEGPVRGHKDPAGLYIFSNIPYATVPKGPHKFSAPLPPPVWTQPLATLDKGIICPQAPSPYINLDIYTIQEECLIANVYVPITEKKDLPVIVYVHGGAFEMGYGDSLTPKNFVKNNKVIVVTFNYRLGFHGFLCLGTDDVPGNAGMKDQVTLLHWVQRNIASFGGNPNEVTIAGYSAGSISVDLLMLAPSTTGLFNKIIQESGVAVAAVSMQADPLENAKAYARKLNFTDVEDIYALEQFYKTLPLESLFASSYLDRTDSSLTFAPCVERKTGLSAFITDSPINIVKDNRYRKIPILVGMTSMEGLFFAVSKFDEWKIKMNQKFSDFLPADLHFENEEQKEKTAKVVKEFYFGNNSVNEDSILRFIDYLTDVYFKYPTLRTVKHHIANGHREIYLYEYSFVDNNTAFVPHTKVRGADHCAQTYAIFDSSNMNEDGETAEAKRMKLTMRELWYNFAVYGKPVPEGSLLPSWPSVAAGGSPYMLLGQTIELRSSLGESRERFWDGIYQTYYREPISPPKPPNATY